MYSLLILTSSLALSQAQINYQPILDNYNQIIPPYNFAQGGRDWVGLCATGQSQSPIDIIPSQTESVSDPDFSAISFNVPLQLMPVVLLGVYPMYNMNGTLWAVFNGEPVQLYLEEVHYHTPAVHLVNGVRYAGEFHATLVSLDDTAGDYEYTLAVVFQEGQRSPFVDSLLNGEEADFYSLLPSPIEDYFYYSGSHEIPEPDCQENMRLAIVNRVLEVSADQIATMESGVGATAVAEAAGHGVYRDVQPLYGRTVYHRVPTVTNSFLS